MVLVDAAWLKANYKRGDLVLADVRWFLGEPEKGHQAYRDGHIPGAHFVDLDGDLASPAAVPGGRHPLPSLQEFSNFLQRLGVQAGDQIVAYDVQNGAIAARLWWLLNYFQVPVKASVLDGGLQAYLASGGALSDAPVRPQHRAALRLEANQELTATAARVTTFAKGGGRLLDARSPERYRGENEPIDPQAGHIPGAENRPWSKNLEAGRFLTAKQLRRDFEGLGIQKEDPIVCYCGSGVTACHNVLALHLAGMHNVRLYVGSWSDWSSSPERPVAAAPAPRLAKPSTP